ncbi:MAG TPA: AAA-like domain-containing protein, partial [Roseiflexaceae bacterium]|nr:AAA-like domain-containing protein [Roseiflexaceae bacterium]
HFIGHGEFDPQAQDGALIMEDEDGLGFRVSGQDLSMLLHDYCETLRLVILNACEGARTSGDDPFSGTAQRLVQQGIPAVIAMQFAVTDETAIAFSQEFYAALTDGFPVDAALTEGRKAISAEAHGAEWGTPVLYMRAPDGQIFDLNPRLRLPTPIPPPIPVPVPKPHESLDDRPNNLSDQANRGDPTRQQIDSPVTPQPTSSATVKQLQLEAPEGTMNPESPFYIDRPSDPIALEQIVRAGGVTVTITGPRQIGKSSLLMRMKRAAEQAGKRVAYLDFQQFDSAALADPEVFFRQFCAWVGDELGLEDRTEEFWSRPSGNIRRASRYFEHYLFKELKTPLVLAMDEVDSLFHTTFRSDFFGMLRAWHNARSNKSEWCLLDLVQVTSTEPYRLIENLNQSPFNVGETIAMADFTIDQVAELNRRHSSPLTQDEQRQLTDLLRGHPYLIRRALYLLAGQRYTLPDLLSSATADAGPFDAHLSYYLMRLHEQKELAQGMLQVVRAQACAEERVCERLESMGLARRDRGSMWPRCRLYAQYFEERLRG